MTKKDALALARDMRDNISGVGVTNGSGYFVLKSLTIDEENDIVINVVAELCKFYDDRCYDDECKRRYYSLYNYAEISGGDTISETDWSATENQRVEQVADIIMWLCNKTFSDKELERMYAKVVSEDGK